MSIITAGIDEVGTGALCGPFISAVAAFREKDLVLLPSGVKDSKKTTEQQRQHLYLPICAAAYDIGIGHAWPWEIDRLGHRAALQLSYKRALEDLCVSVDLLYVDGIEKVQSWKGNQQVEPRADAKYREVSAASIVAKFFRDQIMIRQSRKHPQYSWEINKGYGTPSHALAIEEYGLLIDAQDMSRYLHRVTFCKKFLSRGAR